MTGGVIDIETRSVADLKKVGVHRYAEHPSTSIVCRAAERGGDKVIAHNAQFERALLNAKGGMSLTPEQMDCTMARAQVLGLPPGLDALGEALNAEFKKDKDGHRLMMQMCRPREIKPDGTVVWWDDPERMGKLQAYCDQDVRTEVAIDKLLPPLTPFERRIWELDQAINDRGVAVDVLMIETAQAVVEEAKKRADRQMWILTEGAVKKVTEAAKIVAWLSSRGIPCESVAEGEFEGLLVTADLMGDETARQVIELRQASAKAFKFPAMLDWACNDGRIRGTLNYMGTQSGRWAGRGPQFHNMKRVSEEDEPDLLRTLSLLGGDMPVGRIVETLELFGSPLEALSLCARAMVVAPPGHKLVGGDFSNIEGRINAWVAGEQWKLKAFREYDRGMGPDLYKVTAGRILNKDVGDVTKSERQDWGKVPELACGYQGALGAFKKMGAKYGVRMPDDQIMRIVGGWREANPKIVQGWWDLQDAAIDAVENTGCVVEVFGGKVKYVSNGQFLFCQIPSGGVISYVKPSVEWKTRMINVDGEVVKSKPRRGVSYWGTKKGWRKLDLYGGAQCAHVVSRMARDRLCDSMLAAEAAGFPIVLTVHDELLTEPPLGPQSAEDLKIIMETKSAWLGDCPITAATWEGPRYVK